MKEHEKKELNLIEIILTKFWEKNFWILFIKYSPFIVFSFMYLLVWTEYNYCLKSIATLEENKAIAL